MQSVKITLPNPLDRRGGCCDVSVHERNSSHGLLIYLLGAFDGRCTIDRTPCTDNGLLDHATID